MTTRNMLGVGIGYSPDNISGWVYNRTGATLAVGELVMIDHLAADGGFGGNASAAAYVAQTVGNELHPHAQVITPTTAGIGALNSGAPGAYFGVVEDVLAGAGADDTLIKVCWKGITSIKMASTVGAGEYGKVIVGANAVRTATATYTVGNKALGRLLQNTTTANTNALVIFNGIEGFGIEAAS